MEPHICFPDIIFNNLDNQLSFLLSIVVPRVHHVYTYILYKIIYMNII